MTATPTPELRFVKRAVKLDPFYIPNKTEVLILQQKWQIVNYEVMGPNAIEFEWRDVPCVEES